MKKFFYITVLMFLFVTSASAQRAPFDTAVLIAHVGNQFPKVMPIALLKDTVMTKVVLVEKYSSKPKYHAIANGVEVDYFPRIGEEMIEIDGQYVYSYSTGAYLFKGKVKKQKAPKSQEQIAQQRETGKKIVNGALVFGGRILQSKGIIIPGVNGY